MSKTILITGSTDGIGLETAKLLVQAGHKVLLHGRSAAKLEKTKAAMDELSDRGQTKTYLADLSRLRDVAALAEAVSKEHKQLDALINNAGVYVVPNTSTDSDPDIRFVVNTVAPYLLTRRLLPLLGSTGRVVNVSSAAQSPVNLSLLEKGGKMSDEAAYAQSKLALTMWSRQMADELGAAGPVIVAVNPASLLGSKMVKEAYGVAGGDLQIGANILLRAAVSPEFEGASGKYYDNDQQAFSRPHRDALDADKNKKIVRILDTLIERVDP